MSRSAEHSFFKFPLVREETESEIYDVRVIVSDIKPANGRLGNCVNEAEIFHLNR